MNNDKLQEEIENILYGIQNKAGNSHLFSTDLCTEATKEILGIVNSRLAKLRNAREVLEERAGYPCHREHGTWLDREIKQEEAQEQQGGNHETNAD